MQPVTKVTFNHHLPPPPQPPCLSSQVLKEQQQQASLPSVDGMSSEQKVSSLPEIFIWTIFYLSVCPKTDRLWVSHPWDIPTAAKMTDCLHIWRLFPVKIGELEHAASWAERNVTQVWIATPKRKEKCRRKTSLSNNRGRQEWRWNEGRDKAGRSNTADGF